MTTALLKGERANPYNATERAAVGEAYEQVVNTIRGTVRRFVQRYGGHMDDLVADASVVFCRAYNDHDPAGGVPLEKHVCQWVWSVLLDARRTELSRNKRTARLGEHADAVPARQTVGADMLATELEGDAAYVMDLVLDPPADVATAVARKGGEPRNWRSTLRDHLRDMGWPTDRINGAFADIHNAL